MNNIRTTFWSIIIACVALAACNNEKKEEKPVNEIAVSQAPSNEALRNFVEGKYLKKIDKTLYQTFEADKYIAALHTDLYSEIYILKDFAGTWQEEAVLSAEEFIEMSFEKIESGNYLYYCYVSAGNTLGSVNFVLFDLKTKKEYSLDKYNLPEIQKRLADRSALIAFLMLEDSLSIFIVDRNNIKKNRGLLNQSILSGQIKMMVQSIQKNDTENLDLILKGLYQNIFASIEKNLTQYKKIYFLNLNDGVTDLNYIPLHALRNSNNIAISKRFETYYFGGIINRTMEDNRTGSDILIFDSLTVKPNFPSLKS